MSPGFTASGVVKSLRPPLLISKLSPNAQSEPAGDPVNRYLTDNRKGKRWPARRSSLSLLFLFLAGTSELVYGKPTRGSTGYCVLQYWNRWSVNQRFVG